MRFNDTVSGYGFPLDQPGDSFAFRRVVTDYGVANTFFINGIASAAFRGYHIGPISSNRFYVSKLLFGQRISAGAFTQNPFAHLVSQDDYVLGQWSLPDAVYIGFRFNNGAGVQYGWARIKIGGRGRFQFALLDYAYADPGEPIRAGQMSSDEQAAVEQSPDQGSLGWLALGAVGLLAWRKGRSRTAR